MRPGKRIRTIYTKELVEICRDHRTLIAMIVVPIVLYPLLILGSVNLLSMQESTIEQITVAVEGDPSLPEDGQENLAIFQRVLHDAKNIFQANLDGDDEKIVNENIESAEKIRILIASDVTQSVSEGQCDVGVKITLNAGGTPRFPQHSVELFYDRAELRSESAMRRVEFIFDTLSRSTRDQYLVGNNIPNSVIDPIKIESFNVAPPAKVGGMVLGTIIPLVLVLMTITGAIYPAIDLTAGERERGTLETLIVCPVPPMELITGKYLVVATIAMLGAALNLLSVGLTLYFGGFTEIVSSVDTELPLEVLPIILLTLIPFALLFAAIMVAVCSYARTFKEAQNYIMPVILAALIPGGVAALPGTELTGVNTVVPVMNMVLLARELLLGHWDWAIIALVMVSTSMYAATAITIASRVFSMESVVFADSGSLRCTFTRRLIKPVSTPPVSLAVIIAAVLFPLWMFVQFSIQPDENGSPLDTFRSTAQMMPLFLVVGPALILLYFKVNLSQTFALRLPRLRYIIAGVLIGAAAWIPAHELFVLQSKVIRVPAEILTNNDQMLKAFEPYSIFLPLLLIAVVPAICEEFFFRGFLMSGLRNSGGKWTVILVTAGVFAVFHVILVKFALTFGLGILLGILCWQSKSIWPSLIAHMLHNGSAVLISFWPKYKETLGIAERGELDHLPAQVIAAGIILVIIGIFLARKPEPAKTEECY